MIDRMKLVARALRYRFKLDGDEITFLREWLKRGQTVLDIGAHKGAYTFWMRRAVGEGGRVFAFEPQPGLADRLKKVFQGRRNQNVHVEWMGVSSKSGEMELNIPAGGPSPGASLEVSHRVEGQDRVMVPVETLDGYCTRHEIDAVHFIKCDVEGHELEVFRGGEQMLRRDHPALLFECEGRHRLEGSVGEVFEYLESLGYAGFYFAGGERVPIAQFDAAVHQREPGAGYVNNFMFVPVV